MKNSIIYKKRTESAQIIPIGRTSDQKLDIGSLVLRDHKGYQIIPFDDIVHCEADGNYTKVNTLQGKQFVTCKTLKEVEKKLPGQLFLRVHQSHLVARNAIRSVDLDQNISLCNGISLPLARRAKTNVYRALGIK